MLTGCGTKPEESTSSGESASAEQSEAERCERRLAAALQKLQPEAMAVTARRDTVVNGLNSWLTTCGSASGGENQLSEANAALLSPSARRFAAAARFTENDTLYIRDCFILRELTAAVWKKADADAAQNNDGSGVASDRDRIFQLFHQIIKSVVLIPADESRVPVGMLEILVTGRGSVEDRIWIFGEALRQRNFDSFILTTNVPPTSTAVSDIPGSADRLIGVALEGQILLFDPVRGTVVPVPSEPAESGVLVSESAGLEGLKSHERWKSPSLLLISGTAAYSPRMLLLQNQLPADHSAMLYEELGGGASEIRPLVDRITDAGSGLWAKDKIALWDYPEARILAAGALNEEQKKEWQLLMKPFDAPFERDPLKADDLLDDPGMSNEQLTEEQKNERRMMKLKERYDRISQSSDELFGKASQRFLKIRLEQVMGLNDIEMIQQLQQIRIATRQEYVEVAIPVGDGKEATVPFQLPEAIRAVHRSATGDALYWTATCQQNRNDLRAAVTTFRNYRHQYPDSRWKFGSMYNEGICQIRLGDNVAAAKVLAEADTEQNAERQQAAWLLARLAARGVTPETAPVTSPEAAPDAPAAPATPATPADPAPATPQEPETPQEPATQPTPATEPSPSAEPATPPSTVPSNPSETPAPAPEGSSEEPPKEPSDGSEPGPSL